MYNIRPIIYPDLFFFVVFFFFTVVFVLLFCDAMTVLAIWFAMLEKVSMPLNTNSAVDGPLSPAGPKYGCKNNKKKWHTLYWLIFYLIFLYALFVLYYIAPKEKLQKFDVKHTLFTLVRRSCYLGWWKMFPYTYNHVF